ncbi:MAG: RHS repeat-associated core domain-containing protein, partial [Bacteroidaceae bacterium]|nr:RHS repeat-associated core domain-containing protein [Bacteroidaceae bacterium]
EEILEDGVVITPETITTYTRDAAGRVLTERKDIGAMTTIATTQYDLLGREVSRTDILNRTTTSAYSEDGLTTTVTTPAGASHIETLYDDDSIAFEGGTGQRSLVYEYGVHDSLLCTTVRLADEAGTMLSRTLTNGLGQTVQLMQPTTTGASLNTLSEYNAKGQMIKQYQQSQPTSEEESTLPISTALALVEYDSMGHVSKQTLALVNEPSKDNSPVIEKSYDIESNEEGVYFVTTQTRYNAEGETLISMNKEMISQLSSILEEKTLSVSERGLTSSQWTAYNNGTKRIHYSAVPYSDIIAEEVLVDGFVLSRKDTEGICSSYTRNYTVDGVLLTQTDGRDNTSTTNTDIAGRTLIETDAAGYSTTTVYCSNCDQISSIIDAQGNTINYSYDIRGRKVSEWGTAIQPTCYGYDDANNLVSLKTFRAGTEIIITDPSARTDGDEVTWSFDAATGLELHKTYSDGSSVLKTYDSFNRLLTETDARNNVKTHSYETALGLLLGTTYSNGDTPRSYTYNHLGQLIQVVDDAGVRSIGYNSFGEENTNSLLADGVTHLITETRDSIGRSTGFTYAKNGTLQHTVTTAYGTDGRIAMAGFMHGGTEKQFAYGYLPGSNLLQSLTMPCNMTLTQSYETQRDLLIGMSYKRGNTLVTQRIYSYDTLERPITRNTSRNGQTLNDSFSYNTRSELTAAHVNGISYSYNYDNNGNRSSAFENRTDVVNSTTYSTNELNQYTSVQKNEDAAFMPIFDADGNQTQIKTTTGVWLVQYNAENRPTRFTSADGNTVVECAYDSHGRRSFKKVVVNDVVILHQRYIYRGYLQIACCDLTRSNHPCLWLITWDPTETVNTRPLAIRKDGTWFAYGWDLTKNICEVFGPAGYIRAAYSYCPYGESRMDGDVSQPFQLSSEYIDDEVGIIYYNYRHYNPFNGKWISRDPLGEVAGANDYAYVENQTIESTDFLGLIIDTVWDVGNMIWDAGKIVTGAVTGNTALMTEGAIDLALDTAAAVVPGVPAGALKVARNAAKRGTKSAAKGAKSKPKKKQKDKKKDDIGKECQQIWNKYDKMKCISCTHNTKHIDRNGQKCPRFKKKLSCPEIIKNIGCWTVKIGLRTEYIAKNCDYYLAGSKKKGSKEKELGHMEQIDVNTTSLRNCVAAKEKKCN